MSKCKKCNRPLKNENIICEYCKLDATNKIGKVLRPVAAMVIPIILLVLKKGKK